MTQTSTKETDINRLATPPISARNVFLLPAATTKIASKSMSQVVYELCIAHYQGKVSHEDWKISFHVLPEDYLQFRTLLKQRPSVKDFVNDKVRFDYNPMAKTGQLVFRMHHVATKCFSSKC